MTSGEILVVLILWFVFIQIIALVCNSKEKRRRDGDSTSTIYDSKAKWLKRFQEVNK